MNRSTRRMSTVMIEIIIKKSAIMFIRIFSFRGIPLFSTIDSTYFLYAFVFLNQASTLCELLAKQKAANKKKGPPGSTGNTIPKTPIPKQIKPVSTNNILINLFSVIIFVLNLHPPVNLSKLVIA